MKNILQNLAKLGNMVTDSFVRTFSVSMTCLLIPKNRTLIGYKVSSIYVTEALAQLIMIYVPQLLTKESGINVD